MKNVKTTNNSILSKERKINMNKAIRRIISFVLAIVSIASVFTFSSFATDFTQNGIYIVEDRAVKVSDYVGSDKSKTDDYGTYYYKSKTTVNSSGFLSWTGTQYRLYKPKTTTTVIDISSAKNNGFYHAYGTALTERSTSVKIEKSKEDITTVNSKLGFTAPVKAVSVSAECGFSKTVKVSSSVSSSITEKYSEKSLKYFPSGYYGPAIAYELYKIKIVTGTVDTNDLLSGKNGDIDIDYFFMPDDEVSKGTVFWVYSKDGKNWVPLDYVTEPATPTSLKLNAGKGKATVKFNNKIGPSGYEVQYSTSSGFSSAKTVTITNAGQNTSLSKDITGLTSGKTYYFRVRAYSTIGSSKNAYSSWTSAKSVKIS